MSEPAVSVVLPTYNEVGNVVRLIEALAALLPMDKEFIVVDDDSPDGTAAAVAELADRRGDVRLILRRAERGLVTALQAGIDASRGAVVVWMDVDFSLPPETVPRLVASVAGGRSDVAVGSRFVPGGREPIAWKAGPLVVAQALGTIVLNGMARLALRSSFRDWTSGFIAARGPLVRGLRLEGGYGEYFIVLVARLLARNARIVEVPYRNVPRAFGESKTAASLGRLASLGVSYVRAVLAARRILSARVPESRP
jgi:dolichol-phosphate mannosyltransferase